MAERKNNSRINPNHADLEELQSLEGVGPGLAQRIVQGRPYQSAEDLLKVSGIGQGGLDRWRSSLVFDRGQQGQAANEPGGAAEGQVKALVKSTPARQLTRAPSGTGSILWLAIAIVLSVFLSVSLTLGILLSINGTLNTGRHERVMAMEAELAAAQSDLADLNSQLNGVEQRVQALQGLSGRMGEVEGQVGELEGQMEQALASVETMQTRFEAIEQITQSLSSRAERFDRFLDGLRDLLALQDPAEAGSPQEAIPSQ